MIVFLFSIFCCCLYLIKYFYMVSVAFLNLLERSILHYIHIRKGCNSVGFVGVLQHCYDAINVFTKKQYFPLSSNILFNKFCTVFVFSSPY